MKAVIQRVSKASVSIDNEIYSSISKGLLILLGICDEDTEEDISWLVNKIFSLRIFSDSEGKMNYNITDAGGEVLVVSQFTLYASTKKGKRPSFIKAAKPDIAIPLYDKFIETAETLSIRSIKTGSFGADMKVTIINDGPVTIIIDTKDKQ